VATHQQYQRDLELGLAAEIDIEDVGQQIALGEVVAVVDARRLGVGLVRR
jgi:hypothetical protein